MKNIFYISALILMGIMLYSINTDFSLCIKKLDSLEKDIFYLQKVLENVPIKVDLTAYPPLEKYTDSTPWITASNKRVKLGYVAVSKDIEMDLKLKFGDRIYIAGLGEFEFQDRMNPKNRRCVDIWMPTVNECKSFGNRISFIVPME